MGARRGTPTTNHLCPGNPLLPRRRLGAARPAQELRGPRTRRVDARARPGSRSLRPRSAAGRTTRHDGEPALSVCADHPASPSASRSTASARGRRWTAMSPPVRRRHVTRVLVHHRAEHPGSDTVAATLFARWACKSTPPTAPQGSRYPSRANLSQVRMMTARGPFGHPPERGAPLRMPSRRCSIQVSQDSGRDLTPAQARGFR